jgi:class 3 adenylate cyclase
MREIVTKFAKYIFLDIVGFTHNRSVEAQTELIEVLNRLVLEATLMHKIAGESRIYLPTGDGICLVLLNIDDPHDIHIRLALSILEKIEEHGTNARDEQRRFKVRIGINSNVDNLIIDINGNQNIAGAGINLAQRVMSLADGNQILVGQPVYDVLSQREQYMHAFRGYTARVKHGLVLSVYQLAIHGCTGLDVSTPLQFREVSSVPEPLSEIAAYYMAHAMIHRAEIASNVNHGQGAWSFVVLLWMLAEDSLIARHRTVREGRVLNHAQKYELGFMGQFKFYKEQDFWICVELAEGVIRDGLNSAISYFEGNGTASTFGAHFITPEGQRKLKKEWAGIWEEFKLEEYSNLSDK